MLAEGGKRWGREGGGDDALVGTSGVERRGYFTHRQAFVVDNGRVAGIVDACAVATDTVAADGIGKVFDGAARSSVRQAS